MFDIPLFLSCGYDKSNLYPSNMVSFAIKKRNRLLLRLCGNINLKRDVYRVF